MVSAMLHRPLRASKPWCLGFRGICQEDFDETEDKRSRTSSLSSAKRFGKTEEKDAEYLFDSVYHEIYPLKIKTTPVR